MKSASGYLQLVSEIDITISEAVISTICVKIPRRWAKARTANYVAQGFAVSTIQLPEGSLISETAHMLRILNRRRLISEA
jgi:hypothetical protein